MHLPAAALTGTDRQRGLLRAGYRQPARYRPDLAGSLSKLGICLSELGRDREAAAA
jgi:hypothetical protein